MSVSPIPDPGVLKTADAFLITAKDMNTYPESSMMIPAVVNAAFAMELFLKSLNIEWKLADVRDEKKAFLASITARQRGHTPSKLFAGLKPSIREAIEREYGLVPISEGAVSVVALLEEFDGLFEQWRYAFEGKFKPVDLPRLLATLTFFSKTINAMPLRWA